MNDQSNGVPSWRIHPWLGRHLYVENRAKNLHLLAGYHHMHVAWYPDGSGIRDADRDPDLLWDRIKKSGDDPAWYNFEFVSDETDS